MPEPTTGLGRTQRLVLHLLALQSPCTSRELSYHWPSLSQSAANSAIERLANRGLVDLGPGDFSRGHFCRSYVLTQRGTEAESLLAKPREDSEYEFE